QRPAEGSVDGSQRVDAVFEVRVYQAALDQLRVERPESNRRPSDDARDSRVVPGSVARAGHDARWTAPYRAIQSGARPALQTASQPFVPLQRLGGRRGRTRRDQEIACSHRIGSENTRTPCHAYFRRAGIALNAS